MIIYPAIDLKEGKCVRLYKGDMAQATIYNDSAANQAKEFENAGFKYLHMVDLNGAISGSPVNLEPVKQVVASTKMKVQLGGGIRSIETISMWLDDVGIERVILGTVAIKNPSLVRKACKLYPNRIVVGIDAKGGMVAAEGWVEASSMSAIELAKMFADSGVAAIIYTDINRDGTLQGVNLEETENLANSVNIPIIASGGIGSLDDIKAIKSRPSISGVIVGKAFYEQKISLDDAIKL